MSNICIFVEKRVHIKYCFGFYRAWALQYWYSNCVGSSVLFSVSSYFLQRMVA